MNEPTVVSNSRTLPVKSSDSDAHETTGDWFADYSDRHGRPPRILHIGNIANNAYLNAHLLNEAGYDCDVLCYDYYHIMACPEWEDADFVGTIDSQNHPDWRTVDLKGFRRPRWFAQGPFDLAVLYLIARRNDRPLVTWMLWQILCALTRLPYYRPGGLFNPVAACFWRACGFLLRCVYVGARINPEVRPTPKRQDRLSRATTLVDRLAIRTANYLISIVKILLLPLWCLNLLVERTITTVVFCSAPMWHVRWWRYWTAGLRERIASIVRKTPVDPNSQEKRRSADELIECFRGLFPDRNDALDVTDFEVHKAMHPLLKELLPRYDIVQGYGTDPVLPMLVGKRPYIAFEHGTIRQIPFEDSSIGRLSALAYRLATGVVITNCDNRTAADRLGIENYRFVPHPIREKHLIH
ncbi:MAG: hypothetical protein O3B95_12450, partial [Chloroflexi bacterium]|nr:hypothetical protein [Chloroflexota bacterium]